MSWNGAGIFNRVYNWVTDKTNGIPITASRMDGEFDNFKTGLENCLTRDGQNSPSADISMASHKLTNLANGSNAGDAVNFGQLGSTQTAVQNIIRLENLIINGKFDFWQRGTSLGAAASSRYLADRWKTESVGSTVAPSRQSFTIGQTAVPNNPKYYHRSIIASSAGIGNYALQRQHLEDVTKLSGRTVTLVIYAKSDAARNICIEGVQSFGTGGTPSITVNGISPTTLALTTGWVKYTVPMTFPSVSTKILGTNGDDSSYINIWFDAGSSFNARTNSLGQQSGTFDVAEVSIVDSAVEIAPNIRTLPHELELCQRYYEKSYDIDTAPGTVTEVGASIVSVAHPSAATGLYIGSSVQFKVTKRGTVAIGDVVMYSTNSGNSGQVYNSVGAVDVIGSIATAGQSGFSWEASAANSSTATRFKGQWKCDKDF